MQKQLLEYCRGNCAHKSAWEYETEYTRWPGKTRLSNWADTEKTHFTFRQKRPNTRQTLTRSMLCCKLQWPRWKHQLVRFSELDRRLWSSHANLKSLDNKRIKPHHWEEQKVIWVINLKATNRSIFRRFGYIFLKTLHVGGGKRKIRYSIKTIEKTG